MMYGAVVALLLAVQAVKAGELPFECACPWVVGSPQMIDLQSAESGAMDCESADVGIDTQSAILGETYKWPNGQVPYQLDESGYNPDHIAFIHEKIAELSAMTSCINIYERAPDGPELEYVQVYNGGGCSSYVGRRGGGQLLSLHYQPYSHCLYDGIVWHEFMHALGFYHEQSREDRDNYICIDWTNIVDGYAHNFNTRTTDYLGTPYTYGSVMHYGPKAFAFDRSKPTIYTCDPTKASVIGQRSAMDPVDIDRINARYCP